MKKALLLFLAIFLLLTAVSCSKTTPQVNTEPQVSQMKAICELAVMECYYHNVAKYYEEDAVKGFLGIGSKDKHFWIEYSGVVQLGVDISLVNITVNDTQISITIPEATVLGCKVDSSSLSKSSFIIAKNSADITAEDETKAFGEAQTMMLETASNDKVLLASAQQRAMMLLENYIYNIGKAVDKQYTITWIYVDADGHPVGTYNDLESEPENATDETPTQAN